MKRNKQSGIVLLLTLIIMVVLATVTYTMTIRVAAQKHRNNYMIDYQTARYACDSAVKYAIASLENIKDPMLIERPNEPDFSDVFAMDDQQYKDMLEEYDIFDENDFNQVSENDYGNTELDFFDEMVDTNDTNDFNNTNQFKNTSIEDHFIVSGPYGPAWPYIQEPAEFEIGSAKVKIEIEDENAKYPMPWVLLSEEDIREEAVAGFETFCEWMDMNSVDVDQLVGQLNYVATLKTYKMKFEDIKQEKKTVAKRRSRRSKNAKDTTKAQAETVASASAHTADFARLFHSSLINHDLLAKPAVASEERDTSALKYVSLWGANKVNINSAPRHVLEAAFAFGGDSVVIADEIIKLRKIKPIADIGELKNKLFRYSVSIEKSKDYITMASDFFTIKVTVVSGNAKATAVIAVKKVGDKFERVAVISG